MIDLKELSTQLDEITAIDGTLGYLIILFLVLVGHTVMNMSAPAGLEAAKGVEDEEEEKPSPPRNFTKEQLAFFDGAKDEDYFDTDDDNQKPVYLSLNGTVFNCTKGREFYGPPDGPYAMFAGKECGVALSKMSFDTQHIGDLDGCSTKLNAGEKMELDNWIEKFTYYRNYPVLGKVISDTNIPNPDREVSVEELAKHTGAPDEEVPEGYAIAPIYVAVGGKVFDVSFGGSGFYGSDGGYSMFAGKEVSRSLAKMSFNEEDQNNMDLSELTDTQKKTLKDWINTFEVKKKYPIVGIIKDFPHEALE